ncbi:MAG: TRAP transporter small permease subunit [Deltaproteobacteria bacterium]|nr:TRAP transporter small permease subunit [Deltaproteobacteria bacterium]
MGKKGKQRRRPKEAITRRKAGPAAAQGGDDGQQEEGESPAEPGDADDFAGSGPQAEASDEPVDFDEDGTAPQRHLRPMPIPPSSRPALMPGGARWAEPLVRVEHRWTWIESWLLFVVLMALMLVLCFWVSLAGMSSDLETPSAAGTFFRALVGAAVLGALTRWLAGKRGLSGRSRDLVTAAAVVAGFAIAPLWRPVGIAYFRGVLDWLQEGSSITLAGGLIGVSTRLTLLAALIGASLAAAGGRHINIDLLLNFVRPSWRLPVNVASSLGAVAVCLVSAWGFLDYIAIYEFRTDRSLPVSAKVAKIGEGLSERCFFLRKQLRLDAGALPYVVTGRGWNNPERMNGRAWNEWLEQGGFPERFGPAGMAAVRAPDSGLDMPRPPFVVAPGGPLRGTLVAGMDLLFPLGLLLIGLRFLLRTVLALGRHVSLDPNATDELEDDDVAASCAGLRSRPQGEEAA